MTELITGAGVVWPRDQSSQGDVKGCHRLLCQNLLPEDGEIIRSAYDGERPSSP